jgi:general secretion pathway protein D
MTGMTTRTPAELAQRSRACLAALALAWVAVSAPAAFAQQTDDVQPGPTLDEIGAPERPEEEGEAQGLVRIDFKDAPLEEVVRAIALQSGINILYDASVTGQKVTLVAHHPVPASLALPILETILAANNLQITKQLDGNVYRISARAPGIGGDKMPITSGKQTPLEGFERFAIHIVEVKFADAEKVAELLGTVGSQDATINAYPQSNILILRDTAEGVRNMLKLLSYIDIPGTGTSVEIFTLNWTRAEMLADQVTSVLLGDDSSGAGGGGAGAPAIVRRQPARVAAAATGQPTVEVIGQDERVLRVVPDERLNALIVVASEGMMTQVRFLVDQLDRAPDMDAENIHYRQLLNADAEPVAAVLEGLVGSAAPQQGGESAAASGEVQAFERKVFISAYKETNALLILATPQDYRRIDAMISQLDIPRRMVSVESIIMEVTINDDWGLGVEAAAVDDNFFALSNTINLANILSGGLGSAASALALGGAGGTFGIIDGTIDLETEAGTISVPNIPLLIKALEIVTDVDVLSNPNLMIVDNEEASINVGQEIPIITSLGDVDDRTGFAARSQVQRRDTGVTLTVSPQIREGDNVAMKVSVEVSSPVRSSVGIDPNATGVTVAQSVLETLVVVPNGKTGVIGGLIRESLSNTRNQVPFLGDIPVIGLLFRSTSKTRMKQNLAILLTPQIVREEGDLTRVADERMRQFYSANIDAVFEKGMVKRIKGKHDQRKTGPVRRGQQEQALTGDFNKTGPTGND